MSESAAIDMDGVLVPGHIPDLLNRLWTVATVWYQLGLQLGISTATLNVIERDHPNTRERFTKLLEEWMKGKATKRILINALRSESIQEKRLADDIEKWNVPSSLRGTLSKIQTCRCSVKTVLCLLVTLVIMFMLFHQQTTYMINVQSPSKQMLLPLSAPSATQSNSGGDDLDACLPDLPTLKSLALPLLVTQPLIGREKETKAILKRLEFHNLPVQIVSIVGGPGVGKSALALAVGSELVQQGITVCYVDMYNVSGIMKISKHLEEWAKRVRHPTLLILDNCDHYIHTQKQEFQNLVNSQKYCFVKILITSQVGIPVAFSEHSFEEYHLQNLNKDQAKILLQQSIKGLTSSTAGHICDLVDSMPLAIINIAAHFNLKGTCNLQCTLAKLEEDPIDFFTETEMPGKYSVIASIRLAYDYISLDPNYQKCGWELVNVLELKYARENVCLDEIVKKHLIVVKSTGYTGLIYSDACVSHQLHLDLDQCYHTEETTSTHVYRLPRLIKKYFLKTASKHATSKLSSVASEVIMQERVQLQDYAWFRMCTPLLERNGELITSWSIETNIIQKTLPLDISTYVHYIPLKRVVEVGAMAFYWGTPSSIFETDTVKKFAASSLEMLNNVIAEHNMATSRNKDQIPEVMQGIEQVLAAYVYFNHKSLGIQWPTRTQCPNPTEAVTTMLKRKHQVEVLHHMTGQNDLAWSAYRAFYIDLFSCCMAAPELTTGCEQLWEYWLKGIVGQAVATNYIFQHASPCEGSHAVTASSTFRGLWYYYNNRYSDAKYHLIQELLEQENQNECHILRIATIMALYNMSVDMSARAKVINHLSDKLTDFGLPQYQKIYHRVILPFYREVNKSEEAERLQEQLFITPHNLHNIPFECKYIYWVHSTSYESYVLPPYVDHKGVNPLSHRPVILLLTKIMLSSFVIVVTLEYAIFPCIRKNTVFVQHLKLKFLKIAIMGIVCAVIQFVFFSYYNTYIRKYTLFALVLYSFSYMYWTIVITIGEFITGHRWNCFAIINLCFGIILAIILFYLLD